MFLPLYHTIIMIIIIKYIECYWNLKLEWKAGDLPLQKTLVYENGSWLKPRFTLLGPLKKYIRSEEDKTARGFADKRTGKRFQIRTFFQTTLNNKQETLCVVTIAMICSTLASLWKSQYFQGPIYNPVEDLYGAYIAKI